MDAFLTAAAEAFYNGVFYVQAHISLWATYLGWAVGVVSFLQYLKRKYDIDKAKGFSFLGWWQMDGPRIMATLYAAVAGISTWLSQYASPDVSATSRFTLLVSLGLGVHRFIVSPAGDKLAQKLAPYFKALQQLQSMEQGIAATMNTNANHAAPAIATQEKTTSPVVGSVVSPNDTEGR